MPDVFETANILVNHALRAHEGEIALILYYGSYAKGNASPTSDLDLCYIADAGKARALSSQFVLEGLPYDFWPISWEFAEAIANAEEGRPWAVAASLIADAQVLYHRSPEELARFEGLQARIAELLQPQSRSLMVKKALDAFKETLFALGQLRLAVMEGDAAGSHWAAQQLVNGVANCLALLNQTYFSKGWGANFDQILALAEKPATLETLLRDVLQPEELAQLPDAADRLSRAVRATLYAAQISIAEPVEARQVLKDFYFYVFEYTNKVLSACERGDVLKARFAALDLQGEIAQRMNKVTQGFYPTSFNLLGEYLSGYENAGLPDLTRAAVTGNLATLARLVRRLDAHMQTWMTEHDIDLGILHSKEDLCHFLNARDPV